MNVRRFEHGIYYLLIAAALITILYFSRWIFFYHYDPEYYENFYYHSQYNYYNSTRGISDGELYKFVGYRLAQGGNPFDINPEAPPFAKYLYGLAEKFIGNPFWVSIGLYLASILVLFIFAKEIFKDKTLAILCILLFVTTPFVATQVKETMLDLPLMFLILVHVWLFTKFISVQKTKYLLISGIFLGLATGTKVGVYTPFVIILCLGLFFLRQRKLINSLLFVGSVFAGYVLSYISYFTKHPNPIPWIRLHEKPLSIYMQITHSPDHLNEWRTIFTNSFSGWWTSQKLNASDWSPLLPIGVICTVLILFWAFKHKKVIWIYITLMISVFLVVNTYISFWPRYLMSIIPLLTILIIFGLKKYKMLILALALVNFYLLLGTLSLGNISGDDQATNRFISTRAYRELYRAIDPRQQKDINEKDFVNTYENFLSKLKVRSIDIETASRASDNQTASVTHKIKYTTDYGIVNHESNYKYQSYHNQWKLVWSWDYLWPGYGPNSKIVITEKDIPLSNINDENGNVLVSRGKWKAVYVLTRHMFDWPKYLTELARLTGQLNSDVEETAKKVIPDDFPRFIGYLSLTYDESKIKDIDLLPGIKLVDTNYLVSVNGPLSKKDALLITKLGQTRPELFFQDAEIYLENDGRKIQIPTNVSKEDLIIKI